MSSETARGGLPSDVPDAMVRAQLDRILASDAFSRSENLRRFLSFIVEQKLAGQGRALKESVLAHELYRKGTDFDGGTDPVVRVDARRLRDRLREYYEGRSDPVVISLPKGSYVPVFERNLPEPRAAASAPGPAISEQKAAAKKAWVKFVAVLALLAVIVTAVIAWRGLRVRVDDQSELLPLASYPGAEGPPALSPDGDLVAFAWSGDDQQRQTDIYVKAVESEALRRLTETPDSENSPAWSPDGRSIAFVRVGHGVFTTSQLGGAERQVSASGTEVAWAGDSKSVLIRDQERNAGPFSVYQVFLDTLERRRLTQPTLGPGDWKFEVSPDGGTLAFIRYEREGIADLYVVPMKGGEPRRLSNWNASITGLSWTPDSREIVYSVEEPAAGRLWRIRANSGQPGRGSRVGDIPASVAAPSVSRPRPGRRARLAFQTITRDVDIQMMDLEARPMKDVFQSTPFSSSTRIEGSPRFSADASRIAFASDRSGGWEIWIARRDGGGLRQITSLGAPKLLLGAWSPDDASIAFDAPVAGNDDVYVVGADGGHLRRLTTEPSMDGVASWSGDGRWIYFSSTRAGAIPDIWRISSAGGPAARITRHGGFEAKESSDGKYLFYLDRHPGALAVDGTARVMRAPVAGGSEERVVEGVRPFLWSVTQDGILFVTREADFDAIDLYRFSDQRVTRIGRLGFRGPSGFRSLAVSRDGRWALATKMVRFDSDLMRIDNFR
jgi:Tol biopolymer transport system component